MLRKDGPAGDLPITVADAVEHCRAPTVHQGQVESYLRAAFAFVEDHTGLTLIRQDYILERSGWWGSELEIPVFPIRSITSVKYWDENEVEQTVGDAYYRFVRTEKGGLLRLLSTFDQPALQDERTDVVNVFIEGGYDVEGTTGSGDDADLVFDPKARQCVLLLTEHWYENRSAADDVEIRTVPFAVQALLAQLRIYR